jgi:YgiT-type zinc finger domain-containing protein
MRDGPSKCPQCGGALDYDRKVERAVRYKDDVALVKVRADVCTQCGERLYRPEMVDVMEQARDSLKNKRAKARVVGRVYDYRKLKAS